MDKKYFITLLLIAFFGFLLRAFFPGKILVENDAVLYTEIVKIVHGINPFPHFTFKWTPVFLSGYYGWFLSDLRASIYFILPFLKVQFYFTVLLGVALVFSTYRLAMRLYGDNNVAILSSFIISIIPIHVSMSYGLSAEIPQTFLLLESFNFLIDFINKQKLRDFFISGVLFAFSIQSKMLSILLMPSICFLVFINKKLINGSILKFLMLYFILPFIIWLSWAIPNFYRIFGNYAHSLSSFILNIGSESMKISLIDSHLEFLSVGGIYLFAFSLLCLLGLHKKQDIFILFSIAIPLLVLHFLKDAMTYWLPFIVPFYSIAMARAFFGIRVRFIKAMLLVIFIYFVGICLRTNIINLHFDFNSQAGFYMRPSTRWMMFPLVQCQVNLDTVKELRKIIDEDDVVFLSHTFESYKGFLMDIDTKSLPVYRNIKQGTFEYKRDWVREVSKIINDAFSDKSRRALLVLQDGGYYYRVHDKGVWLETHQDQLLEAAGFKKIYEKTYPDKETIDKSRRYYKHSSAQSQWAKNYIFVKEYK
ncbi:MAG: glycosyltransferase family 39 protein [Candidatus Omnitrophota bacterium]